MTFEVSVRKATLDEIEWINSSYDRVGFMHSDLSKEIVVIAEIDGQRAGLGRLVEVRR